MTGQADNSQGWESLRKFAQHRLAGATRRLGDPIRVAKGAALTTAVHIAPDAAAAKAALEAHRLWCLEGLNLDMSCSEARMMLAAYWSWRAGTPTYDHPGAVYAYIASIGGPSVN